MNPEFIKWLKQQQYQVAYKRTESVWAFSWDKICEFNKQPKVIISFKINNNTMLLK